jgi:hypothetical protein
MHSDCQQKCQSSTPSRYICWNSWNAFCTCPHFTCPRIMHNMSYKACEICQDGSIAHIVPWCHSSHLCLHPWGGLVIKPECFPSHILMGGDCIMLKLRQWRTSRSSALISNNSIRERRKGEKKQENTGQNYVTKAEERKEEERRCIPNKRRRFRDSCEHDDLQFVTRKLEDILITILL